MRRRPTISVTQNRRRSQPSQRRRPPLPADGQIFGVRHPQKNLGGHGGHGPEAEDVRVRPDAGHDVGRRGDRHRQDCSEAAGGWMVQAFRSITVQC